MDMDMDMRVLVHLEQAGFFPVLEPAPQTTAT